jgi:hypothetical protein
MACGLIQTGPGPDPVPGVAMILAPCSHSNMVPATAIWYHAAFDWSAGTAAASACPPDILCYMHCRAIFRGRTAVPPSASHPALTRHSTDDRQRRGAGQVVPAPCVLSSVRHAGLQVRGVIAVEGHGLLCCDAVIGRPCAGLANSPVVPREAASRGVEAVAGLVPAAEGRIWCRGMAFTATGADAISQCVHAIQRCLHRCTVCLV